MDETARTLALAPPQASVQAGDIDALFHALVGISSVVLLALFALIWVFCIRYRAGTEVRREHHEEGEERVELIWTLSPLLIFFGLFAWAATLYIRANEPPEDALQIQVLGRQWMWEFYHPDGTRELNELHVPTGRPVRLLMASEDVIHSVFIPAFRIKHDVVPGRLTQTWFTPNREGTYHLFCAEYCGTRHSRMTGRVIVTAPAAYGRWLDRQGDTAAALARRGRVLFDGLGCRDCHGAGSSVPAPLLDDAFGQSITLADGGRTTIDESYIRESILDPERQVRAGYEAVMPSYMDRVSEADIMALTAYIRSLGGVRREE